MQPATLGLVADKAVGSFFDVIYRLVAYKATQKGNWSDNLVTNCNH